MAAFTAHGIAVTTAAFVRSHGHEPRGRGIWIFQQTTHDTALDRELVGDLITPVPAMCTIREAVEAMARGGVTGHWAVMP